ncbi:MAG: hypothetical protein PHD43_19210 [Methylococcales bacterium]|nr:hypothetical protein [Methylococcales bacterium]
MKNYRIFLFSLVTFSCAFSIGLGMPVDADTAANAKENVVDKSNTSEYSELQKPLDLSIPYKDPENADLKIKQNTPAKSPETNIFATETIKKSQPLQLNGGLLMSPEPEAEKRKSIDGAGIVINIKP